MRNILKNPLKVIVAGMFVVAMGFGTSTSLKISETSGDVDLLALSSAVARGEGGSGNYHCRWHSSIRVCLPGNAFSFRPSCSPC